MVRESGILRSLLFVPGDSESKLAKARSLPADALILDWEDSVLPNNRPSARERTAAALRKREEFSQLILIRCNPAGSEDFRLDCDALTNIRPDGVMLSKCRSAEDVAALAKSIEDRAIYPLIESAAGILNAADIAKSSERVAGLALGAEDFSAEMGIHRTAEDVELLYARSALVTAARASGREAYDSPCLDLSNAEKLACSAQRARNLGFAGQLAIHPSQVPVLNSIFAPSQAEFERARRLTEAFAAGNAGVMAIDGQMVDEAVLRRARGILKLRQ